MSIDCSLKVSTDMERILKRLASLLTLELLFRFDHMHKSTSIRKPGTSWVRAMPLLSGGELRQPNHVRVQCFCRLLLLWKVDTKTTGQKVSKDVSCKVYNSTERIMRRLRDLWPLAILFKFVRTDNSISKRKPSTG